MSQVRCPTRRPGRMFYVLRYLDGQSVVEVSCSDCRKDMNSEHPATPVSGVFHCYDLAGQLVSTEITR